MPGMCNLHLIRGDPFSPFLGFGFRLAAFGGLFGRRWRAVSKASRCFAACGLLALRSAGWNSRIHQPLIHAALSAVFHLDHDANCLWAWVLLCSGAAVGFAATRCLGSRVTCMPDVRLHIYRSRLTDQDNIANELVPSRSATAAQDLGKSAPTCAGVCSVHVSFLLLPFLQTDIQATWVIWQKICTLMQKYHAVMRAS